MFESRVIPGIADSNYMASESKESVISKKYLLGLEHLYIISEKRARLGIEDFCDFEGRDNKRNLNAYIAITKQSPREMFSANFL